jgi:putative transposase
MIERQGPLSLSRQCQLLELSRTALYYQAVRTDASELELMTLIDRQYLQTPLYGSRRMAAWLKAQGHAVNRKRVQRLMQRMGLAANYQRPRTSRPAPEHRIYLYLLRGLYRAGRPGVGGRYHLHPNGARVSLPGRGDGLGEAATCWSDACRICSMRASASKPWKTH